LRLARHTHQPRAQADRRRLEEENAELDTAARAAQNQLAELHHRLQHGAAEATGSAATATATNTTDGDGGGGGSAGEEAPTTPRQGSLASPPRMGAGGRLLQAEGVGGGGGAEPTGSPVIDPSGWTSPMGASPVKRSGAGAGAGGGASGGGGGNNGNSSGGGGVGVGGVGGGGGGMRSVPCTQYAALERRLEDSKRVGRVGRSSHVLVV
jgi:hypothetical protein